MTRLIALLSLIIFSVAPAHAAWLEASSPHFVVYANDKEERIRQTAIELEQSTLR